MTTDEVSKELQEWIEATTKTLKEFNDDRNSCSILVENKTQAKALEKIVAKEDFMIEFYYKDSNGKNYAIVDTNSISIPFD
jgi:phage regulator Rha-like protein